MRSVRCVGVLASCCAFLPSRGRDLTPDVFQFSGKPIRGPSTVMAGILGGIGGFMLAYQSSSGRLMGYFPNSSEVRAS
jgi:hypothetical protein